MIQFIPTDIRKDKQYPNIFVVGRPGKGQKFYLNENGNKIEEDIEKYISNLKEEN